MKKRSGTARYSAEKLKAMIARGEDRTDWGKVDTTAKKRLSASIAADPDDVHEELDWTRAVVGIPPGKRDIHIRIDADVLSWFKKTGRGYQTRINNVLRAFVESRKHTAP
jgi:uncharacterized protein (DUF4415 family)